MNFLRVSLSLLLIVTAACATSAVQKAKVQAQISLSDPLETKVNKTLFLLNEQRYFYPQDLPPKLHPPFDVPYNLDSLRSPEQILAQKIGGSCGSTALAFAAILINAGVPDADVRVVPAVVNRDLGIICPRAGSPRVDHPRSGASGHVFVAVRFPNGQWRLINPIDGSKTYGSAPWMDPDEIQKQMAQGPVLVPTEAYQTLPKDTYGSGLTVFQSWTLRQVPRHNFEQRFDLIASGRLNPQNPLDPSVRLCRYGLSTSSSRPHRTQH
jgi:hypothetical protein